MERRFPPSPSPPTSPTHRAPRAPFPTASSPGQYFSTSFVISTAEGSEAMPSSPSASPSLLSTIKRQSAPSIRKRTGSSANHPNLTQALQGFQQSLKMLQHRQTLQSPLSPTASAESPHTPKTPGSGRSGASGQSDTVLETEAETRRTEGLMDFERPRSLSVSAAGAPIPMARAPNTPRGSAVLPSPRGPVPSPRQALNSSPRSTGSPRSSSPRSRGLDKSDKRYPCPVPTCEAGYARRPILLRHFQSKHAHLAYMYPDLQPEGFQCPVNGCTATFVRKGNMVHHFRRFHPDQTFGALSSFTIGMSEEEGEGDTPDGDLVETDYEALHEFSRQFGDIVLDDEALLPPAGIALTTPRGGPEGSGRGATDCYNQPPYPIARFPLPSDPSSYSSHYTPSTPSFQSEASPSSPLADAPSSPGLMDTDPLPMDLYYFDSEPYSLSEAPPVFQDSSYSPFDPMDTSPAHGENDGFESSSPDSFKSFTKGFR